MRFALATANVVPGTSPLTAVDNAADCGADHYIHGSRVSDLPPGLNVLVVAFGSENELGPNADKQLTLPGDANVAVKIGEITVVVPRESRRV